MNPAAIRAGSQRGMTLVEILVSMVVSLAVTLAVYQTFAASEGYRRAATAGGDAVFNGSLAMYTLQRELRMAGFGLNTQAVMGCRVLAHDAVVPTRDFEFTLAPVVITQGAAGAPDIIEISYSATEAVPIPIRLTQATPNTTTDYFIESNFGIVAGQLFIVAEPGQDCVLQQATNTPSLEQPGYRDRLKHTSGYYTSPVGAPAMARYNKPSGLGPLYSLDGIVFPIGDIPTVTRYTVAGENLVSDPVLLGTLGLPVAAGIVHLHAQYGKDTNNDGAIDTWDEVTPINPNGWAQVVAVRLALLARSATAERPAADGQCTATTALPQWTAGVFDISARADWRCFRYRVFEATVSLRNMIWRPV